MDLTLSDQAELLAEGLGIQPASYAGREADAIVAMTLVAGYRRMVPSDQAQLLFQIDKMHLGPAFSAQCATAVGMMTANPLWVPGSLTNEEVETEQDFWRGVSAWLTKLGFGAGLGTAAGKAGHSLFNKALDGGAPAVKAALTAKNLARGSVAILGYAAQTIAQQAIADMAAQAKRNGELGKMSPLHVERATQ